jgi:hypothetical protein
MNFCYNAATTLQGGIKGVGDMLHAKMHGVPSAGANKGKVNRYAYCTTALYRVYIYM